MAQKKSGGSSKNGRKSKPKNMGLKKIYKNFTKPGDVIIRQKGSLFFPGQNTLMCKDYTIVSLTYGYVFFKIKKNKKLIYVL